MVGALSSEFASLSYPTSMDWRSFGHVDLNTTFATPKFSILMDANSLAPPIYGSQAAVDDRAAKRLRLQQLREELQRLEADVS